MQHISSNFSVAYCKRYVLSSHPEHAYLAARYLEASLAVLRYNFGAAGPDTTELQVTLFSTIGDIISNNVDIDNIYEHTVLQDVLDDVVAIAWKCAIEYSRVGREEESVQYEKFAVWLQRAASVSFCTCLVSPQQMSYSVTDTRFFYLV